MQSQVLLLPKKRPHTASDASSLRSQLLLFCLLLLPAMACKLTKSFFDDHRPMDGDLYPMDVTNDLRLVTGMRLYVFVYLA